MYPIKKMASDEGNTVYLEGDANLVAISKENSSDAESTEGGGLGADDESKNNQTICHCLGQPMECVIITASATGLFCFLYAGYERVPPAACILVIMLISVGYCNYIFWACIECLK
jgi:hypothetical protein